MEYAEHDLSQVDPEAMWALENNIDPLVNIVTFGWTEDGRCGFPIADSQVLQTCPKPVASLRSVHDKKKMFDIDKPRFVCHSASAGSRHTLMVLIDCNTLFTGKLKRGERPPKRKTKVRITGLNQRGLCEEQGHTEPVDVELQFDYEGDRATSVVAGCGRSYVITEQGALYAFGNGNYGVLGNEKCESVQVPFRVQPLLRKVVIKVAAGFAHTMALTDYGEVFTWGKNDKGQLGLGFESPCEVKIAQVQFGNLAKYQVTDISCGHSHSMALVVAKSPHGDVVGSVYAWGDETRGQLGSGDAVYRMRPQENRWLTKFLATLQLAIQSIHAGGYHNLVLLRGSGQVVAWGANEYGQLGNGFQWDDPTPKIVNGLQGVTHLAAGLRHNAAACDVEVFTWGYNGSGELGLGDTDLRLQPTQVSAIKNTKVFGVSCGDRHTAVVTSHRPVTAKEDSVLRPYFKILENERTSKGLLNRLKHSVARQGLDPALLDDPDAVMPSQVGSADKEIKNDAYARGLRYCLDTYMEPFDWRRKAMETCFECFTRTKHLKSVCLSCARNCVASYRLVPYIRRRQTGDICDCRLSGLCQCAWSEVRAQFDRLIDEDKCIGPDQVRGLLKALRAPYPVEGIDVEDCLLNLAEGQEDESTPRIAAVPFEKWYRKYYDEQADDPLAKNERDKGVIAGSFSRSTTGLSIRSSSTT